jgi:hypothetical protein
MTGMILSGDLLAEARRRSSFAYFLSSMLHLFCRFLENLLPSLKKKINRVPFVRQLAKIFAAIDWRFQIGIFFFGIALIFLYTPLIMHSLLGSWQTFDHYFFSLASVILNAVRVIFTFF